LGGRKNEMEILFAIWLISIIVHFYAKKRRKEAARDEMLDKFD